MLTFPVSSYCCSALHGNTIKVKTTAVTVYFSSKQLLLCAFFSVQRMRVCLLSGFLKLQFFERVDGVERVDRVDLRRSE